MRRIGQIKLILITTFLGLLALGREGHGGWNKISDIYQGRGQSLSVFEDSAGAEKWFFIADSSHRLFRMDDFSEGWTEVADTNSWNPRCILMIPGTSLGFVGRFGYTLGTSGDDILDRWGIYWSNDNGATWTKRSTSQGLLEHDVTTLHCETSDFG